MRSVEIVSPLSSLGGRRFEPQAETMLHGLAETAASTLPGSPDDVVLIPEMPSPLGLPDFIALTGGREWLRKRRGAGVRPLLAETDCAVLAKLHPIQALSQPTVARRIGWSASALEPVIDRLERAGAVERTPGGSYRANPALTPVGSLFALEVKVRDWQKAVLQGRAYRTWANNYIVVLGEVGPVAEHRATQRVADDGAGLFAESGWIVRPRVRQPAVANRLRGFEHLFAAVASSVPAL